MAPTYYYEGGGRAKCTKGKGQRQWPSPDGPFTDTWDKIKIKTLYWAFWWPLTSPYRLCRAGVEVKEWWRKEHSEPRLTEKAFQKQRRNDRPRTPPKNRKRALSLLRNEGLRMIKSDGKQGAALLTRLPFDIRLMIWELVIPQRDILIFHGKRRLVHMLHQEGEQDAEKRMVFKENAKQNDNLLALMKTCRLM